MLGLGSFGHAIMFVCTLAAVLVATPFVFLHISHIYLTVLTYSSGGVDRINWPRDSYYDWFPEGLMMLAALFVCGSLSLAAAGAAALLLPVDWTLAVWMAALWLVLPVCLCSMLASPSKLLVVYPPLLVGMAKHPAGVVFVYVLNIPISAAVGWGVWLIAHGNIGGVFLLPLTLPACLLLHARSWGRLVWLAMNFDVPRKRKKRKPRKPRKPTADKEAVAVELEAIDEETDGYGVSASSAAAGDRLVTLTEHYDQQMEYERKLRRRTGDDRPDPLDGPETPTLSSALGRKTFSFLGQDASIGACITLGISCGIEAMLVHLMLSLFQGS